MNKRTQELGTLPIKKLVLQYSIPSVVAMVVMSIYNIVDRIFVGHYVGEEALAGLTIAFPIMLMSGALSMLLGGGAPPLIAIRLGQKKNEDASRIFGTMISISIGVGLIIAILGTIFREPLLFLFGASRGTTLKYAEPYIRIIFLGLIFQILAIILSNTVRTEGQPRLAMMTQITSALINIVLDYLFVIVFHWGIKGAAWATIAGQIFGALWLVSFYFRGKSALSIRISYLIPDLKILLQMVSIGFSMFITQFGASFSMMFLNRYLRGYGGTQALTAMGAINSLYTLFIMPLIGIQQGLQPIISFNYGAGKYQRERDALKFGIALAVGFSSIIWLFMEIFPIFFLSLFIPSSSTTIPLAVQGLRIFISMLPFLGFQMIGTSYFMAVNRPKEALLLSSLRQFILLIPILALLAPIMGILGVWLATPIADGIASATTFILVLLTLRKEPVKQVSAMEVKEQEV